MTNRCARYDQPDFYHWVITLRDVPIGDISLGRLSESNESAEIGYCLGYAYWGQGFMTEAVRAVIDFLFDQIGLHRVVFRHAVDSPASGAIARKCGMTREGTERESYRARSGEYLDVIVYSVLRSKRCALN